MEAHITEDELELLAYLHEHAEGYTEDFLFDAEDIATGLSISLAQLKKDVSYLAAHHLAGMVTEDTTTFEGRSFLLVGVWLTGQGEDYMRALEKRPGIARKVTVGVVKELANILRAEAAKLLGDMMMGRSA